MGSIGVSRRLEMYYPERGRERVVGVVIEIPAEFRNVLPRKGTRTRQSLPTSSLALVSLEMYYPERGREHILKGFILSCGIV